MKSILHDKREHTCFLCMMLNEDDSRKNYIEEHHVFFGPANRKLSEKYGLKVYLCVKHHRGNDGVHTKQENNRLVQAYAQRKFMETHRLEEFRAIFGRNYLE